MNTAQESENEMRIKGFIRGVLLVACITLVVSGCDFLQGGGSAATFYELSRLSLSMQGRGVIMAQPAPLSNSTYPKGTTVQLKASGDLRNSFWMFVMTLMFGNSGAVDGLNCSLFSNWAGDLAGSVNPASIQVNKDAAVQAVFTRQGVTMITTPGGSQYSGPPPYCEVIYSAGRPLHADFYDGPLPTGVKYMTSTFLCNSSGRCTVAYAYSSPGGVKMCTTTYHYTDSGDIASIDYQFPSYAQNVQYQYDSLGRVSSMMMTIASSTTQSVYCTYDDSGNILQIDSYLNGTYTYFVCTSDSNGNVTDLIAYDQSGTPQPSQDMHMVYDLNGLLYQATLPIGGSATATLGWAPL
jgi:hypothetical protein